MIRADERCPYSNATRGNAEGGAWFTTDQPSTQFGSLGIPEISEAGVELDRKLARLLQSLDVDVPAALVRS